MDSINPVMICIIRVIPNRNPRFHIVEIDVGVGSDIKVLLVRLNDGSFPAWLNFFILVVFMSFLQKSFFTSLFYQIL